MHGSVRGKTSESYFRGLPTRFNLLSESCVLRTKDGSNYSLTNRVKKGFEKSKADRLPFKNKD